MYTLLEQFTVSRPQLRLGRGDTYQVQMVRVQCACGIKKEMALAYWHDKKPPACGPCTRKARARVPSPSERPPPPRPGIRGRNQITSPPPRMGDKLRLCLFECPRQPGLRITERGCGLAWEAAEGGAFSRAVCRGCPIGKENRARV